MIVAQRPPAEGGTARPAGRPRERLLQLGPDALTDAELLAVSLGSGTRQRPVLHLAEQLLARYAGLAGLLRAPDAALLAERGLGPAKVARIRALAGLLARQHREALTAAPVFESTAAVRAFLRHEIGTAQREIFGCLFLDSRHRLITFERLFLGTVDRASVHPREVLRRALELNAAALILAHNHPSGVAEPSPSDVALTESLRDLLGKIDVRVLDHLVVGRGAEVSFAERGLL